ncbi:hypothetical protein [Streptosporangium sp. NPDC000396]|uniref:hypothetical protein n=1 Tax=Streptosporangium sp. NPDC000396 TaxID=3366185 RepID=UPI00369DBD8D
MLCHHGVDRLLTLVVSGDTRPTLVVSGDTRRRDPAAGRDPGGHLVRCAPACPGERGDEFGTR